MHPCAIPNLPSWHCFGRCCSCLRLPARWASAPWLPPAMYHLVSFMCICDYAIFCDPWLYIAGKNKLTTYTNIEPLLILQKRVMRIILGVHHRSPSEPLFITLKFISCENIFKHLIGRLIYRIYHGELSVLHCLFTKKKCTQYPSEVPLSYAIV